MPSFPRPERAEQDALRPEYTDSTLGNEAT